jgi:hypothetical protein
MELEDIDEKTDCFRKFFMKLFLSYRFNLNLRIPIQKLYRTGSKTDKEGTFIKNNYKRLLLA